MSKTHVVHFVDIGEARYKRVIFAQARTAQTVVSALEALAASQCVPALVRHDDRAIWVDYVPGSPPRPHEPADQSRLVDFFRRLYAAGARSSVDPAPFTARMGADLDYLVEAGLLMRGRATQLKALEARLRPNRAQVGLDYIDPLAKNFVVVDAGLIAIDIEALVMDALLGSGLAKARLRWPFDPVPQTLKRLEEDGGPDLRPQLAWTELCFLCGYFKQKLQQGKPGYVRLEALDRLLDRQTAETPPKRGFQVEP
ncbi:MAG: hypothetical protein ACXIUM_14375 [Wenzhouxiangella sp.]